MTSNTRGDGEALLRLAGRLPLELQTTHYAFDQVDRALSDLAEGQVGGSLVVTF